MVGTLEVFLIDGANPPALIGSWTGPNPARVQGGNEWEQIRLLVAPTAASYRFRFVYRLGGAPLGDCAIDRFCLF